MMEAPALPEPPADGRGVVPFPELDSKDKLERLPEPGHRTASTQTIR